MSLPPSPTLLHKVATKLREPASFSAGATTSILTMAGAQYAANSGDADLTQPTGFDPQAAVLFEAVIESAFLVANADGHFDEMEQDAFKRVVVEACDGAVAEHQVTALLADFSDQLEEDGIDKRVRMVGRLITKREQALEVLRVAGLIAHISEGVSRVERDILEKLSKEFQLDQAAVEGVLADVERTLAD